MIFILSFDKIPLSNSHRSFVHYENLLMHVTVSFSAVKIENFVRKKLFVFFFLSVNMHGDCKQQLKV